MTNYPTFNGYDELYEVLPIHLLDFLKQTDYKEEVEKVERGELALQSYYTWFYVDSYQCWDEDGCTDMSIGDSPLDFLASLEELLEDVNFPSEVQIGIGRFNWERELVPGVEKRIVRVHDIYPKNGKNVFEIEVYQLGEYDDIDKSVMEYIQEQRKNRL